MGERDNKLMAKLLFHPMFVLGLGIRVAFIACIAPPAVEQWYVPFLGTTTSPLQWNPWTTWITNGGDTLAFPYGYAMWIAFLPATLLGNLSGLPLIYAYYATILLIDFCLLLILRSLLHNRQHLLLFAYWLSPIIILASYGLGLNDLIPALFLCLSIVLLQKLSIKSSGALLAAAISAKLSMVVAAPFFLIYLCNNRPLKKYLQKFLLGFGISLLILGLPFLLSQSGIRMLIGNPEVRKIYELSLTLNENISIYLVPLIYAIMLYATWRVGRLNFELFHATTGVAFLLIVLLTPASPGWFIWCIPFLVLYQALHGRSAIFIVVIFSVIYVFSTAALIIGHFTNFKQIAVINILPLSNQLVSHVTSLLQTGMLAVGLILAIRIWREAIIGNEFFRLSRKPFIIGLAGDSGSGKDTFADTLIRLFGKHSVVKLSGDDYHLWDRQKPMWQVMTHLNPKANDLEGFSKDLTSLADGKTVFTRHYNHQTGKMSKPTRKESKDFIIASGLHTLFLPDLREQCDLTIFLDIDEDLRKYFKVKRDTQERGYTADEILNSFEKRESDSEKFIRPQRDHADLVLSLMPVKRELLSNKQPLRLKLSVSAKNRLNERSLQRVLVGLCGLHVDFVSGDADPNIKMIIEGDTSAADISMAAKILCPRTLEFLDIPPNWKDGVLGLMQLITLLHISEALSKRIGL